MRVRYDPHRMLSLLTTRFFGDSPSQLSNELPEHALQTLFDPFPEMEESALIRTVGWISAGMGALALGLFVGRELRQRYKFSRRTPYDFYSHSGDETHEMEFGVGV